MRFRTLFFTLFLLFTEPLLASENDLRAFVNSCHPNSPIAQLGVPKPKVARLSRPAIHTQPIMGDHIEKVYSLFKEEAFNWETANIWSPDQQERLRKDLTITRRNLLLVPKETSLQDNLARLGEHTDPLMRRIQADLAWINEDRSPERQLAVYAILIYGDNSPKFRHYHRHSWRADYPEAAILAYNEVGPRTELIRKQNEANNGGRTLFFTSSYPHRPPLDYVGPRLNVFVSLAEKKDLDETDILSINHLKPNP